MTFSWKIQNRNPIAGCGHPLSRLLEAPALLEVSATQFVVVLQTFDVQVLLAPRRVVG